MGSLVAIVGSTGEGKTSLISAMLGEIPPVSGSNTSVVLRGTVAYVPQVSWIFNATVRHNISIYVDCYIEPFMASTDIMLSSLQVRDNILFGSPFQPPHYEKAIDVTSLRHDLDLLPVSSNYFSLQRSFWKFLTLELSFDR